MICLNPDILARLSSKGVLAYVAASMAGNATLTTATLAGLVRAQTGAMLEGLKELAAVAPELVKSNGKKKTWTCGIGGGGAPVQELEKVETSTRFHELVEDLKRYWDFLNPEVPFSFSGADGIAVRGFLSDHPQWARKMWQVALSNRGKSVRFFGHESRTQGLVHWVRRLGDYAAGPLNSYNKPVEGAGNAGKAIAIEHTNRSAVAAYLAGAR